jgi:hypothetical protein
LDGENKTASIRTAAPVLAAESAAFAARRRELMDAQAKCGIKRKRYHDVFSEN